MAKLLKFSVNLAGTESYRWAKSKWRFEWGLNAHTLPRWFRSACIPPPGMVFVGVDQAQAEARYVAWLAQCEPLIRLFNDPTRHMYKEEGRLSFGKEIEKDTPEYLLVKQSIHAANYREGPVKFARTTGIDVSIAKRLLGNRHRARPEIRNRWHHEVREEVIRTGKLITPFGHERMFLDAMCFYAIHRTITEDHWKEAVAWVPQTSVSYITKEAIRRLSQVDLPFTWHHEGHDGFLIAVTPENVQLAADAITAAFDQTAIIHGRPLKIPIELSVGYSFGGLFPYTGSVPTREEWAARVAAEYERTSQQRRVLEACYGATLRLEP